MDEFLTWVRENRLLVWTILALAIYLAFFNGPERFREYTPFGSDTLTDGHYVIRGSRNNRYCTDDANGLICNADLAGPHETFYLQNLGKNQYAFKSMKNGLWCTVTSTGIRCTSPTVDDWGTFNIRHLGKGKYSIQSNKAKSYCSDSGHGVACDVPTMYGWEFQQFEFIKIPWENIH